MCVTCVWTVCACVLQKGCVTSCSSLTYTDEELRLRSWADVKSINFTTFTNRNNHTLGVLKDNTTFTFPSTASLFLPQLFYILVLSSMSPLYFKTVFTFLNEIYFQRSTLCHLFSSFGFTLFHSVVLFSYFQLHSAACSAYFLYLVICFLAVQSQAQL